MRAGVALASTRKSDAFFNYKNSWSGAWIEDPAAAPDAPVADRYKPLRAFHAANGGERQWLPVSAWKDNPGAVAKPGMVLFVKGTAAYGDHMIFVDSVETDGEGGWVVHTVEGNAPGAKTKAHKYTISAKGKTEIKAVARPAPLDFDGDVRMVDKATYTRLLKDEK